MPTIYAPWEDSPGKGSRDFIMEPANEWGSRELTKYLGGNWGDPYGVFTPDQVSAWKAKASAPYNTGAIEGFDADSFFAPGRSEGSFDFSATPFTEFTTDQLNSYLGRLASNAAGSKLGQGEAPFLPTLKDHNGQTMVSWGNQNNEDSGFGDMMAGLVGPALMAGVGALSGGFGLSELLSQAGGAGATGAGAGLAEEAAALGLGGELGGSGLIPGISQAEAIAYVKDARDAIEAISRLAEVGGASADAGATALGFTGADAALQSLVPSMLNAAANGVPGASSSLPQTPPTPPTKDIKDWLKTASNVAGLATAVGALGETAGNAGDDPFASIRADEDARQDRIKKSVADIRGQFGKFDDNYLKGVSSSYLDYYLPQFNEQAKEARRQTVFATPSAGTSAFARRAGQLETDIGRQEANIRSQAQAQAQSQKAKLANQEETLISQAEGAGGIADASARAASAADIASTPQPFSPLGQLFAAYTGNVANAAQAERLGYQPTGIVPNIFSRPGGRQPVQYVG